MNTVECGNEIKKFIEQTYECEFRGKIKVVGLDEETYNLRLTLNSFFVPLNITRQGTIEEFLDYIKDEIKKRRLNVVEYYTGYKGEKPNCSPSPLIVEGEDFISNNTFTFTFDFKLS